jgi:hypothetical protein
MNILPPDVERTLTVGREAILSVCCVVRRYVDLLVLGMKSRFASSKPQNKYIQSLRTHVT